MNRYQTFSNRIKPLRDMLVEYVSNAKRNETRNLVKLKSEIFEIFDQLEGPEEKSHKIKEIRRKIENDMDNNSFNDIEVASYIRDLLVYGYK
ncbi:hypothetical protein [Chryseobacterium wangxinyae]|uniref:hypothetical protein n=1 Tax=Chryseobacterium sp. CY353 TaxID=2997334 RepID=UPI0022703EB0|nr:hypothetical protein [Chryseobacterium sp. CY353]MCY0967906.1 hypothetical protein [Chryseobacterium sp. CY353]